MKIAKEFEDAVRDHDLTTVRIMIADRFLIDPTLEELNVYIDNAEKELSDLYEEHDGEKFKEADWDKDYMNEQFNNLMYNFSKERIAHLKRVCKSIYSEKIEELNKRRKEELNIQNQNSNRYKSQKNEQNSIGKIIGNLIKNRKKKSKKVRKKTTRKVL